jgi:hypothetical protein
LVAHPRRLRRCRRRRGPGPSPTPPRRHGPKRSRPQQPLD